MRSTDERTPIRNRWTAQATGSGDDAVAGALFRSAAGYSPIGERKLAEIHARLHRSERARATAASRRARRILRQLAVAAALMLLGGALYASVMHVLYKTPQPPSEIQSTGSVGLHQPARRTSGNRASPDQPAMPSEAQDVPAVVLPSMPPSAAATPAAPKSPSGIRRPPSVTPSNQPLAARESPPLLGSTELAPPVEQPRPVASPLPQAAPALPPVERLFYAVPPVEPPTRASPPASGIPAFAPPAGPSALARESRLLAKAIAKLRQDGQPAQALAILDQHRVDFGAGALAPEATATRIEALLKLGRNREALSLLDAQHLTGKGVDREMLVARAELRADRGRYTAALHDFDQLLSASGQTDSINDRALYGRAICRAKSGDWEGARRDFESYVAFFPRGRFVEQAQAALAAKLR